MECLLRRHNGVLAGVRRGLVKASCADAEQTLGEAGVASREGRLWKFESRCVDTSERVLRVWLVWLLMQCKVINLN